MKRYFEFVDTKSSKFWEVWIEGTTMFTRFGKIGATGQTTVKEFPSVDGAQAALDKSVSEKLKKGYTEDAELSSAPAKTTPSTKKTAESDPMERWNSDKLFDIALQSSTGPGKNTGKGLFAEYSASIKFLTALAKDDDEYVRRGVAGNPSAPVTLLTALAKDDWPIVRSWVAGNPNTPLTVFQTLLGSFSSDPEPNEEEDV